MNHTESISRLNNFVGEWKTEGAIPATDQNPEIKIAGTDTYSWILDGFFLLHQADVLIGSDHSQTYEIIGFDGLTGRYTMQYYNNKGDQGLMYANVEDGLWSFAGEDLRFEGRFSENNRVFSGIWQQVNEKKDWVYFMEIRLTKK